MKENSSQDPEEIIPYWDTRRGPWCFLVGAPKSGGALHMPPPPPQWPPRIGAPLRLPPHFFFSSDLD